MLSKGNLDFISHLREDFQSGNNAVGSGKDGLKGDRQGWELGHKSGGFAGPARVWGWLRQGQAEGGKEGRIPEAPSGWRGWGDGRRRHLSPALGKMLVLHPRDYGGILSHRQELGGQGPPWRQRGFGPRWSQ